MHYRELALLLLYFIKFSFGNLTKEREQAVGDSEHAKMPPSYPHCFFSRSWVIDFLTWVWVGPVVCFWPMAYRSEGDYFITQDCNFPKRSYRGGPLVRNCRQPLASTCKEKRWPPADSQQDTETLSPTTCKELNAANNHLSLEIDSSPAQPMDKETSPGPHMDGRLVWEHFSLK